MRIKKRDNKVYFHTFRLNEEENFRFNQMVEEAGCADNKTKFIVNRIFNKEFKVYKEDKIAEEYCSRVSNMTYQFSRVGNNYNQIARMVNTHFSEKQIPGQL